MANKGKQLLTQNRLKELVIYDPETGLFTWKITRGKAVAGDNAGYTTPNGYVGIGIDGKYHQAHALAWLYMVGEYPTMLDHVDMDGTNNKFSNLRICDKRLNSANRRVRRDSTTGFKGVEKVKDHYVAYIRAYQKKLYLGKYSSATAAHAAYYAKAKEIFGEYARSA